MKVKNAVLYGSTLAAVAALSVFGTLAYLTDQEEVNNTFTVGSVGITLDEAKVNPDGTPVVGVERVDRNEYHLLPGLTYTKDPTVTVEAGSEESYIRMLVTITNYDALQKIYNGGFLPQNFVEGWDETLWVSTKTVEVSTDGKEATYEFRYKETVDGFNDTAADVKEAKKLEPLFEEFTVPGFFDGDDLKSLEGLEIRVVGHAIQSAGFVDADAAWEAFDVQMEQSPNP